MAVLGILSRMMLFYLLFMCSLLKCTPFQHSLLLSRKSMSLGSSCLGLCEKKFRDYSFLPTWLVDSCEKVGFIHPTEVQNTALQKVFDGNDVILQSATGSGKTLVYALPLLSKIHFERSCTQGMVIVPSRELAYQVFKVLKTLSSLAPKKIEIMPVLEGSINKRVDGWLLSTPPHIIIGTPTEMMDLVNIHHFRLSSLSTIVVDEVDKCLSDVSIKKELHKLLSQRLSTSYKSSNLLDQDLPPRGHVSPRANTCDNTCTPLRGHKQIIFCSATIPQRQHFAKYCVNEKWCENTPELIHFDPKMLVPPQIEHEYVIAPSELHLATLCKLIDIEVTNVIKSANLSQNNPSAPIPSKFQSIVFIENKDLLMELAKIHDSMKKNLYQESNHAFGNPLERILVAVHRSIQKQNCSPFNVFNETKECNVDVERNVGIDFLVEGMITRKRDEVMTQLRAQNISVLFSSSLASRGLDIPSLSHIFLFQVPMSLEDYIHSAGRAGRLGRSGKVITLCNPHSEFQILKYSRSLGIPFQKRVFLPRT